ncbi:MAG: hypothetical protein WBV78_17560, partial [Roseobacter sp.]
MPAFYAYNFAILGTQSTDGNDDPIDYSSAPTGKWQYTGSQTGFLIEENNKNNSDFDGDKPTDQVSTKNQIGKGNAQTTDIDDTARQILWDYTFQVRDPETGETWSIGVVDVDLNNDNDVTDVDESGYYLIFIDGIPTADTPLEVTGSVTDETKIAHADLGGELVCFVAGTLIETQSGPKAIETL